MLPSVNRLTELGYRVVINLMQIFSLTEDIIKLISDINTTKAEVLYFADSEGGEPSDTALTAPCSKSTGEVLLVYTHDNIMFRIPCVLSDGVVC